MINWSRGYPVEVVAFAHGFEDAEPFHCWAITHGGPDRPCSRVVPDRYDYAVKLCAQHQRLAEWKGFSVRRPSAELLRLLLAQREAEEPLTGGATPPPAAE